MNTNEHLTAILAKYVDRYNANELNASLEGLPDDVKGEIYQAVKKYPVDLDLSTLSEMPTLESRARYTVRGSEYYLADREPIPYIVSDLILEGSVNLWYGQFGSKKTWSLLDLAVCVASGKQWLSFDVNPCKVLIVDEESGERRLADRLGSIIRGELAPEGVPVNSVSLAQFNLRDNPNDLNALIILISETGAKLVIIDALADIMLGGDENAVKDTQPVFAGLRKASELTGASFIVIHHSNKLGGYRGSSAIAGAIDSMLLIQSKPESDLITFKTEKVRDGKPLTFAGEANWSDSGFYMTSTDYRTTEILSKAQRFTLDYFTDNGDSTLEKLADYAGELYAYQTLKKAIQALVNSGLLTRKDIGGKGSEATYGLTEKANE